MFRKSLNLFALFVLIFGVFSCSSNSANLEPISTAEPTSTAEPKSTVEPTPTSEIGPPPTLTSGPNWCQAFPWDQLNGNTQEDASNKIESMGFDYGLDLSFVNWADAYDNEVPEGTVIAANTTDCENIIVVVSLGPHLTPTSQSEEASGFQNINACKLTIET